MRTIIAGSRTIVGLAPVSNAMNACGWTPTVVLSGGAQGVDYFGARWAEGHRIPVEVYPANWERFGRAAGPIRNAAMIEQAEALVAVWDGESRGTKDVIAKARAEGLRVFVWQVKGETR